MEGLVLFLFIALGLTWAWNTRQRKRADALEHRLDVLERKMGEDQVRQVPQVRQAPSVPAAAPVAPTAPAFAPSASAGRPVAPVAPAFAPSASAGKPVAHAVPDVPVSPAPWELVVGTSWLNKIGVLVVVVGVALFLGYSMAYVGPAGRVAIGYLLSAGMLAAGVLLERRPLFRNYAYGLVAGGWAGIYFTTYATHAVEAAHIVDSDLVATAGLALVAAGMIAHSLKYRSQTVTTLAYVVAYATMILTPLTTFSVVASVPLAVSLLFIAQRFGWSGVSLFGLISTYGLFILRTPGVFAIQGSSLPGEALNPYSAAPYLLLASYWAAFETAEILGIRARRASQSPVTPLFALNAIGFLGAVLLEVPPDHPRLVSAILDVAGAMYLLSAFIRGRLIGRPAQTDDAAVTFGSVQCAVAIAAAITAWSTGLRFHGPRETLALLIETEMLVAAGLAIGDPAIRRLGSILAVVATGHALSLVPDRHVIDWPWAMHTSTPMCALVALSWYGNREWLRLRRRTLGLLEWGYTWMALLLVTIVIGVEVRPAYQGLAGLLVAAALLEAGLRLGSEYRAQAYLSGATGGWLALFFYGAWFQPSAHDVWRVLPGATVLAYAMAARIVLRRSEGLTRELAAAAGGAGLLGTAFLVLFEWRVLPPAAVAPAWAASAIVLLALGAWRRLAALRWQGYAVLFLAAIRAVGTLLDRPPREPGDLVWAAAVAALLYGGSVLARRVTPLAEDGKGDVDQSERAVGVILALAGTGLVMVLQWRGMDPLLLGPGRFITGAVMLGVGLWRAVADLRWQGYGLLAVGAVMTAEPIVNTDAASAAALSWMAAAVGVLYAASVISRRWLGRTDTPAGAGLESQCQIGLSLIATVLLAVTIFLQVRPPAVTPALGLQGAGLLAAGFMLRERAMRLSGLGLLLLCILKLFAKDVWELEALARILSFVMLGLVLLAVSWVYTRFRAQILKFL